MEEKPQDQDSPEKAAQDRRRAPRIVFPCKIMISSPVRLFSSHTENVSEGGIRVMLEEKLPPMTAVGIELFFEKERPLKCNGRVVWIKDIINPVEGRPVMFDTGIKFITVNEADKNYLKKLIEKLSSSSDKKYD